MHLLNEVAGIDLLRASDRPFMYQHFGTNLPKFSAQFAKDWREGVYKDPSARIAQLPSGLLPCAACAPCSNARPVGKR